MIYINPNHMKIINKQAFDIFRNNKKPTIKDPFLTFLYELNKNSLMCKFLREAQKNA